MISFSFLSSPGFVFIGSILMCLVGYNTDVFQEDYIKRIANKLLNMERNQQRVLQAASAGPSQQVRMGCKNAAG
jgi:hypothetical protein